MKERGFSMIEIMVTIVIMSLLVLMALPKINSSVAKQNLRSARSTVATMVTRARTVAMQSNQPSFVAFHLDTATVLTRPFGSGVPVRVGMPVALTRTFGVTVTPTADTIRFDPRGYAVGLGSGVKVALTRGVHVDSVFINGIGKVVGR